jgi:hypothetical protein
MEGKIVDLPIEVVLFSIIFTLSFWIIGAITFSKFERGAVKYL